MQLKYCEFFEGLGMKSAPIEIIDGTENRHNMEFPANIDDRTDVIDLLKREEQAGNSVQFRLSSIKGRTPIIISRIGVLLTTTPEEQPDIIIKKGVVRKSIWLLSGKVQAWEKDVLERRFAKTYGADVEKALSVPLFGFNGVTLERFEIQNRTARDFENILLPLSPETDSESLPPDQKPARTVARRTGSGAAWDEVKSRWREILPALGVPKAKQMANGETSYICPCCGHGTHGDGLTFIPSGKSKGGGNTLKCFNGSCDFKSGSVIDLVMTWQNVSDAEALHICADAIGLDISANERGATQETAGNGPQTRSNASNDNLHTDASEGRETAKNKPADPAKVRAMIDELKQRHETTDPDYTAYYERCRERLTDPAAAAYLQSRALAIETAQAAGLGFDPAADPANYPGAGDDVKKKYPEPRIIIPCTKSAYIARAINENSKLQKPFNKGANVSLFRADLLEGDSKFIFVVEGWGDALALAEVGAPAVSLNSASNADLFLSEVRRTGCKATFILCLDNDNSGQGAQKVISEGLQAAGHKFIIAGICGGEKDPGDALKADRPAFIKAVADAIERAEHTGDALAAFWDRIKGDAYKPHETGLKWFDDMLDGGLIPQTLTILMATPGAGKTALCQQLAEKMAEHENNVLFLNLEMSKDQLLARAVSMMIAEKAEGKADCMTSLEVLQGYKWTDRQRAAVKKTLDEYRRHNFKYIHYGAPGNGIAEIINYLDETGKAYQAAGRKAPAVILDYLHLVTGTGKADAAETVKQTVATLKLYAMKFNTLAIAISAINRSSYSRITLSSGRDSSAVEYTGDAVLSLDYQQIDEKGNVTNEEMAQLQADPLRKMRLRVLKSRHCAPGRKQDLYYAAAFNLFYDSYSWAPKFAADLEGPAAADHAEVKRKPKVY